MASPLAKPQASPKDEWSDDIGGGTLIKWDRPTELVGVFIGGMDITSGRYATEDNPSYRATVEQDNGEQVSFFAPSALASRLRQVPFGTRVRIVYDGTTIKSSNNRNVKNFVVQTAKK